MNYYVIYKKPRDYPKDYVVRGYYVNNEGIQHGFPGICSTLKEARKLIPTGLVCVSRHKQDDPVIVETWI